MDTTQQGPALNITRTDTIRFEYFKLPITDLALRFMYRIVTPVEFVWMTDGVLSMVDSFVNPANYEQFALKRFHEILLSNATDEAETRKHLAWMFDITKVKVVECQMVPK